MKEIQLSRGYVAIVDDEDFDAVVGRGSWHVDVRRTVAYAMHSYREQGKTKTESLHRFLMDFPVGAEVDHKNGDGLDCRRSNLRVVTHQENARNRGPHAKGVYWHKTSQRWRAYITINRKQIDLGAFKDIRDAERARQDAVRRYFGDLACRPGGRYGE